MQLLLFQAENNYTGRDTLALVNSHDDRREWLIVLFSMSNMTRAFWQIFGGDFVWWNGHVLTGSVHAMKGKLTAMCQVLAVMVLKVSMSHCCRRSAGWGSSVLNHPKCTFHQDSYGHMQIILLWYFPAVVLCLSEFFCSWLTEVYKI